MKDHILHSLLKTDELEIMATDMRPEALHEGNSVHLCLICKTAAAASTMFDKLSDEGNLNQRLSEMFFGLIGTLTDKFGKRRIVECDKN